jgi:uncharacterized protein YjbJ (UPF0337 family)
MKSSTRDEAEGKRHKVKGKVKEVAGKLVKDMNGVEDVNNLMTIE